MIRDVAELEDGAVVRGQVGIVGAGFAGLDLACYLGGHGVSVVLLESGRMEFDQRTQELAHVESVGKPIWEPDPQHPQSLYLDPEVRGEARIRQFGGTSNTWTGKWRIFDRLDFEDRAWVPYSGWPIDFDDLRPFYAAVIRDYGLDSFGDFARSDGVRRLQTTAAQGGLSVSCHVWQGAPLRLAARFSSDVSEAESIDVVLGANATEIVLEDDLERIQGIVFRSLEGGRFELEADHFVLAMGGLEGTRLLLASRGQTPAGVGNEHDLVGRFHQNHPKHRRGALWPTPQLEKPTEVGTDTLVRPGFHVNFQLDPWIQRERLLLNHSLRLVPVYTFDVDYPVERASALREALEEKDGRAFARSALALARTPRAVWKVARRNTWRRGQRGPLDHYALVMYLEQAPNPDSRVYLGEECDALGMPRLVVDWRLTALDEESLQGTLVALSDGFARAGLGRLEFGSVTHDDTFDAAHHIGATRMAAAPDRGVVDSDCRVFGTNNLFIASSSVFPTGHSMAPTLTIVALARRLGAHLREQLPPARAASRASSSAAKKLPLPGSSLGGGRAYSQGPEEREGGR